MRNSRPWHKEMRRQFSLGFLSYLRVDATCDHSVHVALPQQDYLKPASKCSVGGMLIEILGKKAPNQDGETVIQWME